MSNINATNSITNTTSTFAASPKYFDLEDWQNLEADITKMEKEVRDVFEESLTGALILCTEETRAQLNQTYASWYHSILTTRYDMLDAYKVLLCKDADESEWKKEFLRINSKLDDLADEAYQTKKSIKTLAAPCFAWNEAVATKGQSLN